MAHLDNQNYLRCITANASLSALGTRKSLSAAPCQLQTPAEQVHNRAGAVRNGFLIGVCSCLLIVVKIMALLVSSRFLPTAKWLLGAGQDQESMYFMTHVRNSAFFVNGWKKIPAPIEHHSYRKNMPKAGPWVSRSFPSPRSSRSAATAVRST